MKIPQRLSEKILEKSDVQAWVHSAISSLEPWLKDSNFVFFPDYTEHGIEHVEQILATASSIIRDKAWEVITSEDAGILVLSTLLHDCAMHLTEDGFIQLITKNKTQGIEDFNDSSWSQLWEEFLFSASRWDDAKLKGLFGNAEPIRKPPLNSDEMTNRDRKLIGEFLRQHHPRLAHEIALFGVPSTSDRTVRLPEILNDEFADLAGLIARSHGMSLRNTFNYLDDKYNRRNYGGIHAVFLMVVLRISDYLQIQSERAPKQTLQVKEIRSSVSRREWDVHGSIMNIHTQDSDPEAIFIQTKRGQPNNVETYLRLEAWLSDIQNELDQCWAIIGETYSRTPPLDRLGLEIRRVRSSIDDVKKFSESVQYIPKRVTFDIDRAEVLGLLIKPLYGDRPDIGIRELIQNSLDAVRELEYLLRNESQKLQEVKSIKPLGQDADVVVWLDEPNENRTARLVVCDRGVGMSEKTIIQYFLKAGATFRKSDEWAKQFESQAEGFSKSCILRTGRFGVGALSAFLLGNKMKVTTCHINADRGIKFRAELDSKAIELRYEDQKQVGTTIEIEISEEHYNRLRDNPELWDWYCLNEPKIIRLLGSDQKKLEQDLTIPNQNENQVEGWHQIEDSNFKAVYWKDYPITLKSGRLIRTDKDAKSLICNGIRSECDLNLKGGQSLIFSQPLLHILDPDGKVPFELTRIKALLNGSALQEVLLEELVKYLFAFLLVKAPFHYKDPVGSLCMFPSTQFLPTNVHGLHSWIYTPKGLTISESWNIHNAGISSALIVPFSPKAQTIIPWLIAWHGHKYDAILRYGSSGLSISDDLGIQVMHVLFFIQTFLNSFEFDSKLSEKLTGMPWGKIEKERRAELRQKGMRILVSLKVGSILEQEIPSLSETNQCLIEKEWETDWLMLLAIGDCPPTQLDLEALSRTNFLEGVIAAEWFLFDNHPEPTLGFASRLWQKIIHEPLIPFDINERGSKLAFAYDYLATYIKEHEQNLKNSQLFSHL